jgi:hypothetical protein
LRERFTDPELKSLSSDVLRNLDRHYYQSWPKRPGVRVIGLDTSERAVRYAQAAGTVDIGLTLDLEAFDPSLEQATILESVDLIISTGCVGYVGKNTFRRLTRLARRGRPAWVASFVLRMFDYQEIDATLAMLGLETERFEGATFVQRRFADHEEMQAAIRAVEERGLDPRGRECDGLFHAELFLSRPPEHIARLPVQKIVSVVSGANKPWRIGTHALGRAAGTGMVYDRRRKLAMC